MNWYTFRGSNSFSYFFFTSLFNRDELIMDRVCSSLSKYSPLRRLKGLRHSRKQTKSLKLFPFVQMVAIHGGIPIHFNLRIKGEELILI